MIAFLVGVAIGWVWRQHQLARADAELFRSLRTSITNMEAPTAIELDGRSVLERRFPAPPPHVVE